MLILIRNVIIMLLNSHYIGWLVINSGYRLSHHAVRRVINPGSGCNLCLINVSFDNLERLIDYLSGGSCHRMIMSTLALHLARRSSLVLGLAGIQVTHLILVHGGSHNMRHILLLLFMMASNLSVIRGFLTIVLMARYLSDITMRSGL